MALFPAALGAGSEAGSEQLASINAAASGKSLK
jgi:hypothetical protein